MFESLKAEFGDWPTFYKDFPDYSDGKAFFSIEFHADGVASLRIPNAGGMVEINLSALQEKFVNDNIVNGLSDVEFSWGIWTIKSEASTRHVLKQLQKLTM